MEFRLEKQMALSICFSNKKVPDKSDDLLIGGRFFGQSMSLVLVLCPEYFRHIDNNAFLSHIKTLKIWISLEILPIK